MRERQYPACRLMQWLLVVSSMALSAGAVADESASRYHYEDIDRFFVSYDRFLDTGNSSAFVPYLDGGSTGLKNFEEHFQLTPERLAATVQKYPAFFASLRNLKTTIRAQQQQLDTMFEKLQALFPQYPMPDVYFLVGGLRAGGQAGDGNYVMVAGELYVDRPGVDVAELSATSRIFTPEAIVHIVAHEAAHIIQEEIQGSERYLSMYTEEDKGTLLAYSLREGVPNLVAKLVSGNHINQEAESYGLTHESELWPIFRRQALGTDLGDWFFYQPKANPEWPRDLGYWMGYRMALKCYEDATDKQAALVELLDAADPEALLEQCAL